MITQIQVMYNDYSNPTNVQLKLLQIQVMYNDYSNPTNVQ